MDTRGLGDAALARNGAADMTLSPEAAFATAAPEERAVSSDRYPEFLATSPAGRVSRRLALAAVLLSTGFFLLAAPFAKEPMTPVWAFIPAYQSALVINDLITAVLLLGQFAILRSPGLLVLAGGYLFTGCMATAHALTFPGLFAQTGLLGAGPQTTAWLYMFWHGIFPLCVIAYCLLQGRSGETRFAAIRPGALVAICIGAVLVAVVAFTALATLGHDTLPAIMDKDHYTPAMLATVTSVWTLSVVALALLWWWRQPHSVLDMWLLVVMCAWIFDIALAAVLNAGRFDLGFYIGRMYGLAAASFVLAVLLLENGSLYAKLVHALVAERSKSIELEAVNKELDAFSYSISHDLRSPLRAISGFSAILHNEHAATLAPGAQDHVERIHRNAQRMGRMLEDLLRFSRLSRQSLSVQPVDVAALVASVLAELREQQPGRVIDVTIGTLPQCRADPSLLQQVYVNLLSNAFKFTRGKAQARIEVGYAEFAPGPAYFVRDNGIGFDMRYAQRLFSVFARLHRAEQFEGSGVGLSIVQRIVERHGGRIGAEAKPDAGACFYFTLPAANRRD